jgi:hypothetical protein
MQTYRRVVCRWKFVLVAALALVPVAARAAEAPLRWKFKEGETLNYVMDRSIDGKLNFSGADLEFTVKMVFDSSWKIKSVAKDGAASIDQTIDRVQMNMSSPLAGSIEYDSQDSKMPDNPLWSQMEPIVTGLVGQTFSWNVTPQGKVSDIKLPEKLAEIFAKQGGGGGGRQQGAMGIGNNPFSEKGVKELIEKSVLVLPDVPPGKDVAWKQAFENPIPRIGTQTAETTFKYSGSETLDGKKVAKITSATELTFAPAEDAQADLEITKQESEATYYFDPAAGRVIKANATQMSALELSGPRDLTQELKETTTVRMGKSPAKSEAKDAK